MLTGKTALLISFLLFHSVVESAYGLHSKAVQFILDMELDFDCSGLIIISDKTNLFDNEDVEDLIITYKHPVILLHITNGTIPNYKQDLEAIVSNDPVCNHAVGFIQNLDGFQPIYLHIQFFYNVKYFFVVTQNIVTRPERLLNEIQSEHLWVLQERTRNLWVQRWIVSNQIESHYILDHSHLKTKKKLTKKLMGRHLTIGTLDFPPIVFAKKVDDVVSASGIEPALMGILAERLNFKFSYILPDNPDEMWGTLKFDGDNVTVTGILGLLYRKKADVSYGDLHMQQRLLPYVDFTLAFRNNYECFLVPAPRPYAKWTALYHPFSPAIWAVIGISSVCAVVTLWFLAKRSSWCRNKDAFFSDWMVCYLYILGNFLGVQQPQEIRVTANRLFLVWWLLAAATIIPTLYRSGLISFITFPYTPAPIDTIQQLVDSPLKKISWGEYFKTTLLNSKDQMQRKLGGQLAVATNVTNMFSLLNTDDWAVMSNQDNLRYEVSAQFSPTSNGPRVHMISECVFPTRSALGLQKGSSLKPYFDREIFRIREAGFVEHITSLFAKKQDSWNPTRANAGKLVSYSLNSLQGAFYILGIGIGISTLSFLVELIIYYKF